MKTTIIAGVIVFLTAPIASGAVINADGLPVAGGRSAILDKSTNRLWLDVTHTTGHSINQVSSMLDTGEAYAGWQLPQLIDIEELLLNANIP